MTTTSSTLVRFVLLVAAASIVAAACGVADSDATPTTDSGVGTSTVPTTQPDTPAPSTPTPTVSSTAGPTIGDTAVLAVVELTGGCAMMGPNCPTYVLWSDGRAAALRGTPPVDPFTERLPDDAVENLGFIDATLAASLADAIATTDFAAMVERLGPGVCNGCVDGIDTVVSVATPSGIVKLASTNVEFTAAEPFFAALDNAVGALQRELPLTVQSR